MPGAYFSSPRPCMPSCVCLNIRFGDVRALSQLFVKLSFLQATETLQINVSNPRKFLGWDKWILRWNELKHVEPNSNHYLFLSLRWHPVASLLGFVWLSSTFSRSPETVRCLYSKCLLTEMSQVLRTCRWGRPNVSRTVRLFITAYYVSNKENMG